MGFHGPLSPSGSPPGSRRPRLLLFQVGAAPASGPPAVSELELPPAATGTVTVTCDMTSESVGPESAKIGRGAAGTRTPLAWQRGTSNRDSGPGPGPAGVRYLPQAAIMMAWPAPPPTAGPESAGVSAAPGPWYQLELWHLRVGR